MDTPYDILSIGEAMVELSCAGDFVDATTFAKSYGGDAFNTSVAASKLGSSVRFLSRLGKDPFADGLRRLMQHENIDIKNIRTVAGTTGVYFASVLADGSRDFVYYRAGSAASTLTPEDLKPAMVQGAHVVFATGVSLAISQSCKETVIKAFRLAHEAGIITVFDPNYRRRLWENTNEALDVLNEILPYVDVILPSVPDDTLPVIGFNTPEQVIDYFWLKGVKLVVAKAGADGCYVGYKKMIEYIPALNVQAIDSTGAGDAFNGGFLHGLALQKPLTECARLGVVTAGLKLQQRGAIAGLPNREAVYSKVYSEVGSAR